MLSHMLPRIVGVGITPLSQGSGAAGAASAAPTPLSLMLQALSLALADTDGRVAISDLDGLIALPSLMGDHQFMIGHAVATEAGLFASRSRSNPGSGRSDRGVIVRTLDVGGAG